MSQRYVPEGLTNRDCERQVSDRPPLPFVQPVSPVSEDGVFQNTGEPRQIKLKLSEDLKMPKSIYQGGTPEQLVYHLQQTLAILRKKLLKEVESLGTTKKELHSHLTSLRDEVKLVRTQLAAAQAETGNADEPVRKKKKKKASHSPRDAHTDTDETGMDARAKETDPVSIAHHLEGLLSLKEAAKKQYVEVCDQQQRLMDEVFDTYDSLLSESQRSDWTKIVEDLCRSETYLSRRNKPKAGPRGQTLEAFHDCIHAHLLTVFSHDAAEQERHYLQCCVKKSPKISIRNFISRMNQLNGYLSLLPCLYDSEYAINTTCRLDKPFTESELAQIVLDAVPATWRSQYNINHKTVPTDLHSLLTDLEKVERYVEATRAQEQRSQKKNEKGKSGNPDGKKPSQAGTKRSTASSEEPIPRKKPKVTKMCQLCSKYGGAATTHNTKECRRYDKDGNQLSTFGRGALKKAKPKSDEKETKSSYAQLAKAISKAVKSSLKKNKKRKHYSRSDSSESSSSE